MRFEAKVTTPQLGGPNSKCTSDKENIQKFTIEDKMKEVWKTVQRKDKSKKKRITNTVTKLHSIAVGLSEGTFYTDMLSKGKTDPKLKNLGERVFKKRGTQDGWLFLI